MISVGVDLGGTKTMAVRVVDGEIVERCKQPTPTDGSELAVIDTIAQTIDAVDPEGEASVIGVGVPGPVRPGTGIVQAAPNVPGWRSSASGRPDKRGETHAEKRAELNVGALLSERFDCAVAVDNDVNVGTLAEVRMGAARGFDNVLGVFSGTGVGAGLVLDGRLRQGPRGLTGEIGHSFVAFRDLHDESVLGRGELEDYAGRAALAARARRRQRAGETTSLFDGRTPADGQRVKSSAWAVALDAGDALVEELVDDAASALATAMASAVAIVDVEIIVLGGGLADRLGEPFRARIQTELDERRFAGISTRLVMAELGDTGGALGAALLAEHLDTAAAGP